ncbi:hypothetical protein E2C01_008734 [Portunus trituberculatus]|uniref:Uncharacterized protein n=1 Tax=Portunus trituberculatus TaxID=210409 RepID=A0A5B7D2R4_PORTR|nr:hypothetical protein [Portunus trituberculatus]
MIDNQGGSTGVSCIAWLVRPSPPGPLEERYTLLGSLTPLTVTQIMTFISSLEQPLVILVSTPDVAKTYYSTTLLSHFSISARNYSLNLNRSVLSNMRRNFTALKVKPQLRNSDFYVRTNASGHFCCLCERPVVTASRVIIFLLPPRPSAAFTPLPSPPRPAPPLSLPACLPACHLAS